jgi:hypothetical protein
MQREFCPEGEGWVAVPPEAGRGEAEKMEKLHLDIFVDIIRYGIYHLRLIRNETPQAVLILGGKSART